MTRVLTLFALVLTAAALAGCGGTTDGPETQAATGSFVGEINGTQALVGLVTNGDQVRAYACDGKQIARWYSGRARNGTVDLRKGETRLQATLTADGGTGTLTLADGSSRRFTVEHVDGKAGVFQGEATRAGVRYLGRWVVAADGAQTGTLALVQNGPLLTATPRDGATIPVYNDLSVPALDLRGVKPVAVLDVPGGGLQMEAAHLTGSTGVPINVAGTPAQLSNGAVANSTAGSQDAVPVIPELVNTGATTVNANGLSGPIILNETGRSNSGVSVPAGGVRP